jgi:hypothetical protein
MSCAGAEMSPDLTNEEMKEIYLILKALEEGQLGYPAEEWELDHFDERPIDRGGIGQILGKLRKLPPEKDVKEMDKKVLLRKYGVFGGGVDEDVYFELEKTFNDRNRVEIEYFSMKKAEGVGRKIGIYYKSRRYIIAFCHPRKAIRKFRTSRIMSARLTKEKYTIPKDFDKKKFL